MPGEAILSATGLTPVEEKRALRAAVLAARSALPAADRLERSHAIAQRLEEVPCFRDARTLALYAALGAEVDASGIAAGAASRGVLLVYPRIVPGDRRLAFARCAPEALVRGPMGALEPPAEAPPVPRDAVDCVLMPGVAFSPDGHRLGRGGGYYDATLEAMPRAARVGLAFDLQLVPALPAEGHDARLDALVTEARVLLFRRESR
ncbi:5-formyltetrahydrofolate cyclo-ligase [Anaeromyxobacter sp. Fw109-5]|uniref:5-formyltetrahydrofolate cyclo-ligase n=1 Tax=Anaeromyxobacter sp. (strain Fw109-5) TaxID=404589 RepID=UPI0000ED7E75|nr:5-formyltetrahydrofolate cyclo-ligase [Anaeromyxobacter sp. Fw109-5]ABS25304.1 5-formyltetrahydrofolate cyclo-ligase [Anaeromyxobacter sp. Fw109-5]